MQLKKIEMLLDTHNNGYYHKDIKQQMLARLWKNMYKLWKSKAVNRLSRADKSAD